MSIFVHLMRRESPGRGWLWRAGPRQGQQRSLRRIGQALSWAFVRSPEARSVACALFASYVADTASGRRSGDCHQFAYRLQFRLQYLSV